METNIDQLTQFDSLISPRQLQIIKSALPYIPLGEQKVVSLLVKFQELKNTIHLYDSDPAETLGVCSSSDNINENLSEMVESIKHYCSEPEKENLDFLYNITCAFNLSRACKNSGENGKGHGFDTESMLKSLLSPEQQAILDSCSMLFGSNDNTHL